MTNRHSNTIVISIKKPVFLNMLFVVLFFLGSTQFIKAQNKDLTWDELANQYECPEWFRDAKFGIWFHWGPQAVPEQGGGWYARHMYMKDVGRQKFGKMANPYHLQTYGHPSEFGFKDIIHSWKAEKFDAEYLINFSKENGAKYIVAWQIIMIISIYSTLLIIHGIRLMLVLKKILLVLLKKLHVMLA